MSAPLPVIDFHTHHLGSGLTPASTGNQPAALRKHWDAINQKLTDEAALLAQIRDGDLVARVVNTPTALLANPEEAVSPNFIKKINDGIADLVQRHPRQIYGLATVDAFAGDAAARELIRAVKELGLRGVFVESAKGKLLLDAPQARPTLETAASLGVPVFVHPVNPEELTRQLANHGRLGTLLARGTVNAASLVALIGSGTLDSLPNLHVVVTTLAIGAILLTAPFGKDGQRDANVLLRRQVYVDTMGFHPVLIKASIDVLGVEHVLAGSDWPIVSDGPIGPRLSEVLNGIGLAEPDRKLIASGNALRLLSSLQKLTDAAPSLLKAV
jgi:aminocarboxymuconate-semialdehyde decarboxylase